MSVNSLYLPAVDLFFSSTLTAGREKQYLSHASNPGQGFSSSLLGPHLSLSLHWPQNGGEEEDSDPKDEALFLS